MPDADAYVALAVAVQCLWRLLVSALLWPALLISRATSCSNNTQSHNEQRSDESRTARAEGAKLMLVAPKAEGNAVGG